MESEEIPLIADFTSSIRASFKAASRFLPVVAVPSCLPSTVMVVQVVGSHRAGIGKGDASKSLLDHAFLLFGDGGRSFSMAAVKDAS